MFAVERATPPFRRFVFVEGHSPSRGCAGVWAEPRDGGEDVPLLAAASYTRAKPVEKPKLGPLLPVIDAILEVDRSRR